MVPVSPNAARLIHSFNPAAQAIAMLRNPLEMLPSLHSQLVFVGFEPIEDFARRSRSTPNGSARARPAGFRTAPIARRFVTPISFAGIRIFSEEAACT